MFVLTIYLIMIFLRFLTERRKQFASALGLLSHRGSVIGYKILFCLYDRQLKITPVIRNPCSIPQHSGTVFRAFEFLKHNF